MSIAPETSDVGFEGRWAAWKARGLAHERSVRWRFIITAAAAAVIVLAVLVTYRLLFSST